MDRALADTKGNAMTTKVTDTQILMLSVAAQREDRLLMAPPTLKGGAAQKVAAKLIAAGFAKELNAKPGAPIWRRDAENGQVFALKLTAAGVKASAADHSPESQTATEPAAPIDSATLAGNAAGNAPVASAPRDGSKISQVIGLLQRDGGATLDEVVAATGWLPHTSRAALTGLRKRGYSIGKDRSDGRRAYFIAAAPQASM